MIDQIVFQAANDQVDEGSRLNVTATFRDQVARLAVTPTTVDWTLRDPDQCREIMPLTSVAPGPSVTLVTTSTQNLACRLDERREVTVIVDRGLATQFVSTFLYQIRNIGALRK
jgi:hypothetical protein